MTSTGRLSPPAPPPVTFFAACGVLAFEEVFFSSLPVAVPGTFLVALIKPQFEAGKERVGKGGIVRDPAIHREICDTISAWLDAQTGWHVLGICESPITGAEGNREFLLAGRFSS